MTNLKSLIFIAGLSLGYAGSTAAQTAQFDESGLQAACTNGQCVQATVSVLSAIVAQGLRGDSLNSQIGIVAAVLFAAAKDAPPQHFEQIAQALALLAEASSDGAQKQSILLLARQIGAGDIELFDLEAPFAASPA